MSPSVMTFIMGRGSTRAVVPPTYRQSGRPTAAAPALAQARLTPRKALAPRRLLLSVPSSSHSARSIAIWLSASRPRRASAISPLTADTAFRTPLPPKRVLSPSRSSTTSRSRPTTSSKWAGWWKSSLLRDDLVSALATDRSDCRVPLAFDRFGEPGRHIPSP